MRRLPSKGPGSNRIFALFLVFFLCFGFSTISRGADPEQSEFQPGDLIMHHILDAHSWHFWDGSFGTLHLPVIVYTEEAGLILFSSSRFYDDHHNSISYNGFFLEHEHVVSEDGNKVYDFSITINVLSIFLNFGILCLVFLTVARGYRTNEGQPPRGIQSLFEPIIIYVRDEIVKPSIGDRYQKYLPYLLTLFFFVWFGNLMGLLPGASNMTGNIAVTLTLAFFTFVLTIFSSNKYYWGHIFNPPGVPWWLKPIMVPIEVIGLFTKPFSLLLRLFVAITAGHIVALSLLALIFIFHSYMVGFGSALIVTFISLIEVLVATIQAYVFTLFSSMYIGMAMEQHHE